MLVSMPQALLPDFISLWLVSAEKLASTTYFLFDKICIIPAEK